MPGPSIRCARARAHAIVVARVCDTALAAHRFPRGVWSRPVAARPPFSLGGIFPFHDRSPVERQIAAGEFVFPDEYFSTVSNDGRLAVIGRRRRMAPPAAHTRCHARFDAHGGCAALDLCCRLLVVEPHQRLSVNGALDHQWFLSTSTLKLPSEM